MRVPAALLTLAAAPLAAQEHPCDAAVTQQELNLCSQEAWQAADAELNLAYGEALAWAEGDPAAEELLRAAQRAWLAFRDADCAVEAAFFEGGSAEPMILFGCLEDRTVTRTEQLWAYVETYGPLEN